jgi:hypothetical protein
LCFQFLFEFAMLLDEFFSTSEHHIDTFFDAKPTPSESLSTPAAMGIGASIASAIGVCAYATWRTVSKLTLRDSSTQVPDYDGTPTGGSRRVTPMMGETGDPSDFLSTTPTGQVRKNSRGRFF